MRLIAKLLAAKRLTVKVTRCKTNNFNLTRWKTTRCKTNNCNLTRWKTTHCKTNYFNATHCKTNNCNTTHCKTIRLQKFQCKMPYCEKMLCNAAKKIVQELFEFKVLTWPANSPDLLPICGMFWTNNSNPWRPHLTTHRSALTGPGANVLVSETTENLQRLCASPCLDESELFWQHDGEITQY